MVGLVQTVILHFKNKKEVHMKRTDIVRTCILQHVNGCTDSKHKLKTIQNPKHPGKKNRIRTWYIGPVVYTILNVLLLQSNNGFPIV